MPMHKDDRIIITAIWTVIGTVIVGAMFAGGLLFWSLPYLLGWAFN